MFNDALDFSDIVPGNSPPEYPIVVDGFLVLAARADNGSIPHLCVASEPTNGIDIVLQFGLKSVAIENAHEFS